MVVRNNLVGANEVSILHCRQSDLESVKHKLNDFNALVVKPFSHFLFFKLRNLPQLWRGFDLSSCSVDRGAVNLVLLRSLVNVRRGGVERDG